MAPTCPDDGQPPTFGVQGLSEPSDCSKRMVFALKLLNMSTESVTSALPPIGKTFCRPMSSWYTFFNRLLSADQTATVRVPKPSPGSFWTKRGTGYPWRPKRLAETLKPRGSWYMPVAENDHLALIQDVPL